MQQTFTQTITVLVGDPTGASLANTGVNSLLFISLALTLITLATGLIFTLPAAASSARYYPLTPGEVSAFSHF